MLLVLLGAMTGATSRASDAPSRPGDAPALAPRFDAGPRVLRVTPVPPDVAVDAPPAPDSGVVRLCGAVTEPGEALDLGTLTRPAGWTLGASAGGAPACLVASAGAVPLEIALPEDRDHVTLRFARAGAAGGAVVELAGQTRFVDLAGDGSASVELGRGVPLHAWSAARSVPYERALVRDAGFARERDARFARRFVLDGKHGLDPFPILPSATVALPAEITFPEVFVPARAELELAVARVADAAAGAATAAPVSLRIETTFVPLVAEAPTSHAVTVLAGHELQSATIPLGTRAEGGGLLTVRLAAVDAASAGARIEIVDPRLRGVASVAGRRPSVVLVTLDTVRADHLSLYGYARATTPFLQELASQARVFDAAYSQTTNTRPSHFSLMTGRYCGDIGIWNNDGPPLPQRELTVAEVLRSAGWATGAVVSVGFLGPASGLGQGFDEMSVPRAGQHPFGAETTRTALDFVRRRAGEPFFLWAHYFDAHLPYQPVPELRGLFWQGPPPAKENVDRTLILPEFFDGLFVLPNVEYMTAMYDASLRYLDEQMRALIDGLRAAGVLDDTLVVIAADHGESLGDHGIYFVHSGLYEPTVHVPLLVRAPRASVEPGRITRVVENLDIPATIFAATGLAQPESFRGGSLLAGTPGDDVAFFEHYGRFATGMRRGSVKTIDQRELKSHREQVWPSLRLWYEAPSLQMFDVVQDPGELHDLASSQPELLRENLGVIDAWRTDRALRSPVARKVDPKLTESLRALGYTE